MSWEDVDFGVEFFKIDKVDIENQPLYDDQVFSAYIEPFYDTLTDYQNNWNKKRKRMRVYEIRRAFNTPYVADVVVSNDMLWLDMGARLFNAIKPFAMKKTKYLHIMKLVGKRSKFDVQYHVSEYKLQKQKKIDEPSKKTKK